MDWAIDPKRLGRLELEADEAEKRLWANPLAAVEVAPEAAELMGAFEETAVGLEDFEALEPGALDWLLGARSPEGDGGGEDELA